MQARHDSVSEFLERLRGQVRKPREGVMVGIRPALKRVHSSVTGARVRSE